MTQPLALVLYERLLPGSQLVNRLQDLNYRVQTVSGPASLVDCAQAAKPLLVLVDLQSVRDDVLRAVSRLRKNPSTGHLPVIAFGGESTPELDKVACDAGVTLVAGETAILTHLPQFLEQALQVE